MVSFHLPGRMPPSLVSADRLDANIFLPPVKGHYIEWFRFSPMVSPLLSPPPAPQWGLFRNIPTLHYSGDFDVTSPSPCSGDFYVTFPTVLQWAWVTSSPHCTAAGNITSTIPSTSALDPTLIVKSTSPCTDDSEKWILD